MTTASKSRFLAWGVGGLLLAAAGIWLLSRNWNSPKSNLRPTADAKLPTTPVTRPPKPPEGYVGSAACAGCHGEICSTFAQHPMGRSSALTPGPADLEDTSPEKASFTAPDGTRYQVEKIEDRVLHHEIGMDGQGRVLYDHMVPISLAIGSGTRGKTYAVNSGGVFMQSPISWYSAKGGYFELSPGYENPGSNRHFTRRITTECLVCHLGRMEFDPNVPNKLQPPYYHEIAIGCERCHGPGEKHIARQRSGKTPAPDATIVNPARLSTRERESVCYQCHLHGIYRGLRYGREHQDFRPGMSLEEIFCVLVKDEPEIPHESKAVTHVEQMRASACFLKSEGKLGCISCHNPHQWPKEETRTDYYRNHCVQCHVDKGCSLPSEQRAKVADSCIACHMPRGTPKDIVHASQTDHRVLRKPPSAKIDAAAPAIPQPKPVLKFFDEADVRMPEWEVMRTRGIQQIVMSGAEPPSEEALQLLLPLAEVAPDDTQLLRAIGAYYVAHKEHSPARQWLEKTIAVTPQDEQVLAALAIECLALGDTPAAKKHIAAAIQTNLFSSRSYVLQAQILFASGERELALRAAEKAMELDPTQVQLRDRLLFQSRN